MGRANFAWAEFLELSRHPKRCLRQGWCNAQLEPLVTFILGREPNLTRVVLAPVMGAGLIHAVTANFLGLAASSTVRDSLGALASVH